MAWQDDTLHRQVAAIVRLLERQRLLSARSRRLRLAGGLPRGATPATIRPQRSDSRQR